MKTKDQPQISDGYWSLIENGKRSIPKADTSRRMAKGLRLDVDILYQAAGYSEVNLMLGNIT
ncbi:transcriptional regulator [Lentilactobacillus curieae]|uniref:Transcriptional regulator n=1 Tax=Lentilactobacillus curieae TaxID=1138822 RepID=A0A1S6QIN1_9LACO|nr:helix-turn-helix transcriptional regulator [Lentilactobacillus curieae]AQW21467.1 transcriptional regulator [Lentilactobacillus curieae]